jgi:hypothetical protein
MTVESNMQTSTASKGFTIMVQLLLAAFSTDNSSISSLLSSGTHPFGTRHVLADGLNVRDLQMPGTCPNHATHPKARCLQYWLT